MARLVFGMNRSLDGNVDHMAFAPSPTLFLHFNGMLGNREAALAAWERAVDDGFPESKIDVYDPMIASVKDDPRFVAALDRVKRRNAEMFARVDVKTIDEWIARGAPANPVR